MTEILLMTVLILIAAFLGRNMARFSVKDITAIGVLTALAVAGRVACASIPSVQPSTFIIIIAGVIFGPAYGFLTGVLTGIVSSLILGIGMYTPWQMFLWGLIGLTASLFTFRHKIILILFGFASGFLFGWSMNLWYYTSGTVPFTLSSFLAANAASFYFDLAHALSNTVLLSVFPAKRFCKQLKLRYRREIF